MTHPQSHPFSAGFSGNSPDNCQSATGRGAAIGACRIGLSALLMLITAAPALAANASAAATSASAAASAYQCQQHGQTVFQDSPCPNGKALDAAPGVADGNRHEASARAAREKAQLAKIEAAKARTEALEARQAQSAARNAQRQQLAKERRARQCQRAQQQQKWAEQDAAGASAKHLEKARRKALRAQEKAQLLCSGN